MSIRSWDFTNFDDAPSPVPYRRTKLNNAQPFNFGEALPSSTAEIKTRGGYTDFGIATDMFSAVGGVGASGGGVGGGGSTTMREDDILPPRFPEPLSPSSGGSNRDGSKQTLLLVDAANAGKVVGQIDIVIGDAPLRSCHPLFTESHAELVLEIAAIKASVQQQLVSQDRKLTEILHFLKVNNHHTGPTGDASTTTTTTTSTTAGGGTGHAGGGGSGGRTSIFQTEPIQFIDEEEELALPPVVQPGGGSDVDSEKIAAVPNGGGILKRNKSPTSAQSGHRSQIPPTPRVQFSNSSFDYNNTAQPIPQVNANISIHNNRGGGGDGEPLQHIHTHTHTHTYKLHQPAALSMLADTGESNGEQDIYAHFIPDYIYPQPLPPVLTPSPKP
eukprot:TRINITY_DN66004_c4_g3_i1.p1 TRINITY_DN66004_c4_g3~~TRINITY_DN66004_c4_g3_i1.p1  ORF type:complete len:411 (+),score=84.88 TRINITY_DN66004_c4_g3_i1:78-1235(+)